MLKIKNIEFEYDMAQIYITLSNNRVFIFDFSSQIEFIHKIEMNKFNQEANEEWDIINQIYKYLRNTIGYKVDIIMLEDTIQL